MLWCCSWVFSVVFVGVAVGLAACNPTPDAGAAPGQPAPTVTAAATQPAPSATATEPAQTTPTGAATATTVAVPNGVGMDYQAAQDAWRAAGLHVSPAVDATGAHRLPIIDSNWVVLSQDPPAGTQVESGSSIVATVKKYTDT